MLVVIGHWIESVCNWLFFIKKTMTEITFRQATNNDLPILDRIYNQNMQEYVAKNYSWDSNLFKNKFNQNDYLIIQGKQKIIGFLKIVAEKQHIYLGEIQIEKSYQNKGIGTKILQCIIDNNKLKYERIWLQVLKGNPAIKLYSRLGFKVFAETKAHYKMQLVFKAC